MYSFFEANILLGHRPNKLQGPQMARVENITTVERAEF